MSNTVFKLIKDKFNSSLYTTYFFNCWLHRIHEQPGLKPVCHLGILSFRSSFSLFNKTWLSSLGYLLLLCPINQKVFILSLSWKLECVPLYHSSVTSCPILEVKYGKILFKIFFLMWKMFVDKRIINIIGGCSCHIK